MTLVSSAPRFQKQHERQKDAAQSRKLLSLLALETEALKASDRRQLRHLAVNNARKLVEYGHGIFFTRDFARGLNGDRWRIRTVSSQAVVDKTSPFVTWLDGKIAEVVDGDNVQCVDLAPSQSSHTDEAPIYPFPHGLWIPLAGDAALFYTRKTPWEEGEQRLIERLCEAYGCAWKALHPVREKHEQRGTPKKLGRVLAAFFAIVLVWPVSMSTLAPAEVVARSPQIVSAPINGVIEKIHSPPGAYVEEGDIIATYVDTDARNEFALMSGELEVAAANLEKTTLAAFGDSDVKRDIRLMQSELSLAERRQKYAQEKLQYTILRAQSAGVLVYSDKDDWSGRPVSVGERILTIANPANVELAIEAPMNSAKSLAAGARIKLFLDSDPLLSVQAKLLRSNSRPEPTPEGGLAYHSVAAFEDDATPRIGERGVAKIYGARAPLGFWLLRRPIVSIRQFAGI